MKHVKDISTLKTITVEHLRSFNGFADISTQEAEQIIHTLKELSLVTHNIITSHEQSSTLPKLRKKKH